MKEAQILLYHYGNIIAEELLALIQAMKQNGTFKKLLDYLYQEDDNQSAASDILLTLLASAALLPHFWLRLAKLLPAWDPFLNRLKRLRMTPITMMMTTMMKKRKNICIYQAGIA